MLSKLEAVVLKAGEMMLQDGDAAVHRKEGHFNYVTDMDLKIQEYLRDALSKLVPGSQFFSEEQENRLLADAPTWIVDPIDGTINYVRGRGCSAVSVALLRDKAPAAAAIYNPFTKEMFTAEKGRGCFLNGVRVTVSDRGFERALVTFGTSPYVPALARQGMRAACQMLLDAGDLRRTGSAALDLAWVACGRCECFFEMELSPWDYAAGALLVQEAGGVFSQPLNEAIDYGRPACVVASNPLCFERARKIVEAAASGDLKAL